MVEEKSVRLRVRKSAVRSAGGVARIHEKTLTGLGIPEGSLIDVLGPDKGVVVKVFADNKLDETEIVLRKGDIHHIEVNEGAEVDVKVHAPLSEVAKEKSHIAKEKFHEMTEDIVEKTRGYRDRLRKKGESKTGGG